MKRKLVLKLCFFGFFVGIVCFNIGKNSAEVVVKPNVMDVTIVKHDKNCLKMNDIYQCKIFDDGEILLYSNDGKIYTFDESGFKFWE